MSQHRTAEPRPKLLFGIALAAIVLISVEGASRLMLTLKRRFFTKLPAVSVQALDPWEMPDPVDPANWVLRPGFRMSLEEIIEAKKRMKKELAVTLLEDPEVTGAESSIRVNRDGFRGSEIDRPKRRPRILMIGDSCTFGLIVAESFTYPVATQAALRQLGRDVEVINAGVEGYSPFNVLKRIEYDLSFDPDIVTIYLGWNAIFDDEEGLRSGWLTRNLTSAYVLEKGYRRVAGGGEYRDPRELYAKQIGYLPDGEEAGRARNYHATFLPSVSAIVEQVRRSGKVPVLITLPGLFATDRAPSPRALEIGHLPYFTSNAFVLAQMAANYNQDLREFARHRHVALIDLERWSKNALPDSDRWFFDSVHLKAEGQVRVGEHLARDLLPILESLPGSR